MIITGRPRAAEAKPQLRTVALGSMIGTTIEWYDFGDRLGRRAVLVGALAMTGLVTTAIGVLPTYAQAGLVAPALLAVLRVLQGLAVGAEPNRVMC